MARKPKPDIEQLGQQYENDFLAEQPQLLPTHDDWQGELPPPLDELAPQPVES